MPLYYISDFVLPLLLTTVLFGYAPEPLSSRPTLPETSLVTLTVVDAQSSCTYIYSLVHLFSGSNQKKSKII